MPYGEIFAGTLRQMWRHKRLWLFGLIGYVLVALGSGLYMGMTLTWQSRWFDLVGRTMQAPGRVMPDVLMEQMLRSLVWFGVGLAVFVLAAVAGYAVNLVMRGATINEAASAWREDRTDTGRGLRAGLSRALHLFAIDLLWWLPSVVIVGGAYVVGIVLLVAGINAISQGGRPGMTPLFGVFGLLGCVGCLALLIAVLYGVFAPLMFQAAMQGSRGVGAAIREGWRLARGHLGPMIVFWLLTVGVAFALNILLSLISIPLMLPWMMSWLGGWTEMMGQAMRGIEPTFPRLGQVAAIWLALAGLGSAVTTWLSSSLMQTFSLTMYAEVYRRLAGDAARPTPEPEAPSVTPVEPPAPLGPAVPDEPAAAAEPGPLVA
jgi:hypothetical protein